MALLTASIHSIFLALSFFCSLSTYGTIAWHHHTNHSCHGCAEARDELAKIRLELIKREILEKLGLDAPPQVRPQDGFPTIPLVAKYLKYQLRHDSATNSMHTSFLADELMMPERKAERTIVLAERTPARFNLNLVLAHFKFSEELMSKLLISAVLNIYLRKPTKLHSDSRIATVQVLVKEVVKNGSIRIKAKSRGTSVLHSVSYAYRGHVVVPQIEAQVDVENLKIGAALAERKRHVDLSKDGYIQIPIRVDDVQRWWSGNDFMGLYVEAFYKGENLALHPQHDSKNMMYLELTTIEEWGRHKRSYQEVCTKEMNEPSCCLYSLVVDFEAAGWDFVIAPKLYDAHMCSGECRLHHVGWSLSSQQDHLIDEKKRHKWLLPPDRVRPDNTRLHDPGEGAENPRSARYDRPALCLCLMSSSDEAERTQEGPDLADILNAHFECAYYCKVFKRFTISAITLPLPLQLAINDASI
uniref:TGF-beta family profile domain-containing protein n=1 Tax=Setaria digitata TaxID=48799 RepID=A0A915Q4X2_9BILA